MSQPNAELILFAQNLKRTSLGVKFAKTLLEKPDSINPKIVTNVMKELGFPISRDLQIGVDAAQALVTGSAVVNRINTGNYTDYKELIKPSAASIGTLTRIGNELGLVDDKTMGFINLGLDAALIFASGGLDLNAWMRVAMSVTAENARAEAEAMQIAQIRAVESLKDKYAQEGKDFAENIQLLQSGKMGLFSFLAESVDEIPIMFPNLIGKNPAFQFMRDIFPGLQFLPVGNWTFHGQASERTFWGEEKSKSYALEVQGLAKSSKESAVDYLLRFMIYPQVDIMMKFRREWLMNQKADLFNVALFALFDKSFYVKTEMDLLTTFDKAQLTPFEIGEVDTFRTAIDSTSKAVTTNFGFGLASGALPRAILMNADVSGNIDLIRKDSQAAKLIRKRFDFPLTAIETNQRGFIDSSFDPRNLANFIACLDMLDMIYSDPQYEQIKAKSQLLKFFDQVPKLSEFKLKFSECMNRSIVRRVNKAARLNVQALTGIPANKLQPIVREGQATIFK